MKLLISIVNMDDAHPLIDALTQQEYRATLVSTTGGFLHQGNATILTGAEDGDVDDILEIIKANCHTRTTYLGVFPASVQPAGPDVPRPIQVQVRGAIVFVLDVDRFERL